MSLNFDKLTQADLKTMAAGFRKKDELRKYIRDVLSPILGLLHAHYDPASEFEGLEVLATVLAEVVGPDGIQLTVFWDTKTKPPVAFAIDGTFSSLDGLSPKELTVIDDCLPLIVGAVAEKYPRIKGDLAEFHWAGQLEED